VCLSACSEDGHIGRNMQWNSENQHNRAARRRKHNLQYSLSIEMLGNAAHIVLQTKVLQDRVWKIIFLIK
jgi:hypothetical protein